MLAGGSRVGPRGKAAFGVRRDRQGLGSQRVLCAYLAGRQASFSPFCSFRFPPQQVGHVRYRGTPSLSFLAQPRRRKLQLPSFLGPLRTLSSSPRPNFSPPLPLPPKSPIPPNNLATPLAPALRRRRCHQAISSSLQFHSLNSDSLLSQRLLTSSSPPPPAPLPGGGNPNSTQVSQFQPPTATHCRCHCHSHLGGLSAVSAVHHTAVGQATPPPPSRIRIRSFPSISSRQQAKSWSSYPTLSRSHTGLHSPLGTHSQTQTRMVRAHK